MKTIMELPGIKEKTLQVLQRRIKVNEHTAKIQEARGKAGQAQNLVAGIQKKASLIESEFRAVVNRHPGSPPLPYTADDKKKEHAACFKDLKAAEKAIKDAEQALMDIERQTGFQGGGNGLRAAERALWEAVYGGIAERDAAGVKNSLLIAFAAYRRLRGAGATFAMFLADYLGIFAPGGELTQAFDKEALEIGTQMVKELFADGVAP